MDNVAAVAGTSRFNSAQMLYDLLYNLDSQLLDIPFDDWRKRPGRGVRWNMTSAAVCPMPPGTCFAGKTAAAPKAVRKRRGSVRAIDCLLEEFQQAKSGFASDFLGRAYVQRAESALRQDARVGHFSSTVRSKRVAVVVACGLFDKECGDSVK